MPELQTTPPRSEVRPEIQALRALAVGAVVLYHFWPRVAPAGFVGVDIFFVVSGYLITGMLLRELTRTSSLRLGAFYARRIRRILPAATVVLLVTAVMTLLVAPRNLWGQYLDETLSSVLYVQNWDLAQDSLTPGREELRSSPVQHFWSLSVEEQFYLVWPLLILAAYWFGSRLRARNADRARGLSRPAGGPSGVDLRRRTVVAVLAVITGASFIHSLVLTAADHNLAYFSTFSRAWEFGVGGLLAAAPALSVGRLRRTRSVVSWVALALLVVSVQTLDITEQFPGILVALPVAATLAVIWAGTPESRFSTAGLARLAPVQWLGDISYSLYLWHWPIVMFTPFITGHPTETPAMVGLLLLSVAVAWASKVFIEDPVRFGRRSHAQPRLRTIGLGLALAALFIAGTVASADLLRSSDEPATACPSALTVSER